MEIIERHLTFISGSATNIGKVRKYNEDGILCQEFVQTFNDDKILFGFYAITDGIGGHECGEVASHLALEILANHMILSPLHFALKFPRNQSLLQNVLIQKINDGIRKANKKVYSTALASGNTMGTTLTTTLIVDSIAYIANIGDSRVYIMRGDSLQQVTTDHSYVAELAAAGIISFEDMYVHPNRNVITRYVGMDEDVPADIFVKKLEHGDTIILCSDGLWEMVRNQHIESAIKQTVDPQGACNKLVETANRNGGFDNISVIVVKVL
jgi:serine/threonine protein phosphatase PrpC